MIIEWGTTSSDSWKQRVYGLCGMNDRGTLKTKLCVVFFFSFFFFFFFFFVFFFFFFSSSFLFVSLKLIINIICK